MSERSPVTHVHLNRPAGRVTFALTAAKVRALLTANEETGVVSEATPFETARALTREKLCATHDAVWVITPLGRRVRDKIRQKQAASGVRA